MKDVGQVKNVKNEIFKSDVTPADEIVIQWQKNYCVMQARVSVIYE